MSQRVVHSQSSKQKQGTSELNGLAVALSSKGTRVCVQLGPLHLLHEPPNVFENP